MTKAYEQINKDTAAANRGVMPDVLVDVYGPSSKAPAAARANGGVSDQAGAQQAQDARRSAAPGQYDTKR